LLRSGDIRSPSPVERKHGQSNSETYVLSQNTSRRTPELKRRALASLPNVATFSMPLPRNDQNKKAIREVDEIGVVESVFEDVYRAIQSMSELVVSLWDFASKIRQGLERRKTPMTPRRYDIQKESLSYSDVIGTGKLVLEWCARIRAARMEIWEDMYAIRESISNKIREDWKQNVENPNE
jgi:hypothetical protein